MNVAAAQVLPLTKPEFLKEVTEASKDGTWVLILLFQAGLVESRVVEEAFTQLARLHRTAKFMKIIATQCIENYPDRCELRVGVLLLACHLPAFLSGTCPRCSCTTMVSSRRNSLVLLR